MFHSDQVEQRPLDEFDKDILLLAFFLGTFFKKLFAHELLSQCLLWGFLSKAHNHTQVWTLQNVPSSLQLGGGT